jgi:BMFP domain-containing protein YqiC
MREKIIDDLAGMMGGAAGLLADIRDQVRGDMRDRMKDVADRIDLVTRDELLALEDRIAALEAMLKPAKKTKPAATPKKKKSRK